MKRRPWPDVVEDVEWLLQGYVHPSRICDDMHVSPTAMDRFLRRHGRQDLAAPFQREYEFLKRSA